MLVRMWIAHLRKNFFVACKVFKLVRAAIVEVSMCEAFSRFSGVSCSLRLSESFIIAS